MSILKRELGAAELTAQFGYENTEVEAITNSFDEKYPWHDMVSRTDENGNTWVRIPKFYTKYDLDEDGYVCARYISRYNVSKDWHLNPIFIGDNGKEVPYVEIATYLSYIDPLTNNVLSISGKKPTLSKSVDEVRSTVENYERVNDGYNYELYNIWAAILEQDLFLIEYANSDTTNVLSGCRYGIYNKGIKKNGDTDVVPYHTGTISDISNEQRTESMKYRHIENMIGNGHLFIDGIVLKKDGIYVTTAGQTVKSTLPRLFTYGMVDKLGFDPTTKLIFPVALKEEKGSYGDIFIGNKDDNQIISRGLNADQGYGLFSYTCNNPRAIDNYSVTRMIRKPDIK